SVAKIAGQANFAKVKLVGELEGLALNRRRRKAKERYAVRARAERRARLETRDVDTAERLTRALRNGYYRRRTTSAYGIPGSGRRPAPARRPRRSKRRPRSHGRAGPAPNRHSPRRPASVRASAPP